MNDKQVTRALAYAQARQDEFLEQLIDFLKIPSVSTQPERREDVKNAAAWLANALQQAGLENVRIIDSEIDGHPLVYADWLHAEEAPTILIYGHYDVQPAEPFDLWETPPFEPDVRDDYLYARGASDDKGQTFIHVKAVEAYLKANGRLPLNVKFLVEGEEESGGRTLSHFLPRHQEMLTADVALISDTAILSPDQPSIVYGLRGMYYDFIDVTGPDHDLHSGSAGGGINNPLNALCHIIAKLKNEEGHVLIPGFYDDVAPLSQEERELLAQLPLDEAEWVARTGAPEAWGEPEYTLVERIGARPTLDVHGIIGGYTGEGGKTIIPSTVHAKVSMRLVPHQDPQKIGRLFRDYVRQIAPSSVTVEFKGTRKGAPASMTDYTIPAMRAAKKAYTAVFGREPVFTREGGSIPVVGQLQNIGLETILMGFGLPDDRIHSPNERFYLPNFYRGIETAIHFLNQYAELDS